MFKNLSETKKGIFALVLASFFGALMGVWVRIMNQELGVYQQIFARGFMAFLFGLVIYRKGLNFSKLKQVPKKDFLIILFRSAVLITGISLYTQAILISKYSNIGFIFSLPMTAVLGVIILREKLTLKKLILILLAFFGVAILSVKDFSNLLSWGLGETMVLIATVFYSLSYVARKWISPVLNNQELSEISYGTSSIFALLIALFFGGGLFNPINLSPIVLVAILFAGIGYMVIGLGVNYGMQKVEAVTGNNFLMMEAVFAVIISVSVYTEYPTYIELIGGLIVVLSAYLMNKISNE